MSSRRNEEYIADFEITALKALTPSQKKLFILHFLLGNEYRTCCEATGLTSGQFFHEIYRIQQCAAIALKSARPYPLWPVREYFAGVIRSATAQKMLDGYGLGSGLRVPLAMR